jgi:uncharacterized protein YyaL (SSP411 family)
MDETTYSDQEIINFINKNFIPVRVDADARPDIDSLYNQGGWPSTAILTPQGEVISGGTYIPPEEMLRRLQRAATLFRSDRGVITSRLEEIKAMKDSRAVERGGISGQPEKSDLENIVHLIKSSFDEKHGGFGSGQKFPNPETMDFLLSLYAKNKDPEIEKIVTVTLDRMAQGGIFDNVEGGFFRYATKPDWSEPHYEKMLEVNAGLIRNYAEASLAFGNKEYQSIVRKCIGYVQAALHDAGNGAFFGSQDADEQYYRALDRERMKAPAVDKTVYADSSSLMISALIAAYGATGEKQYLDMAVKGAGFIVQKLYTDRDGVFHFYQDKTKHRAGLLSDNVLFASALLDLYNATVDKRYLNTAREIGQLMVRRFYDAGAKRFRTALDTSLIKPVTAGMLSEVNDDLANYRALRFLSRLSNTGEYPRLKEIRDASASALSGTYRRFTPNAAAYGNALLWILYEPVRVTILAGGSSLRNYVAAINTVYIPEKVVSVLSPSDDIEEIGQLKYSQHESVYLCAGKRCSAPIRKPERLKMEIRDFVGRPDGN